jgi:large subunit ribosomal protein L14e
LAVIVEIIDQNRVLVDGPTTGVARQAIRLCHVDLTQFRVKTRRGARQGTLKKHIAKKDFLPAWKATSQAKAIAAADQRANLNDFERFKLRLLKKKLVTAQQSAYKKVYASAVLAGKEHLAALKKAQPKKK